MYEVMFLLGEISFGKAFERKKMARIKVLYFNASIEERDKLNHVK